MDTLTQFIILVVVSSAVAAVSMTITKSKVFAGLRKWVADRSPFLGDLVSCPYCFSHWGSLVAVLIFQPRPVVTQWWLLDYLTSIFSMVTFAAMWTLLVFVAYGGELPRWLVGGAND